MGLIDLSIRRPVFTLVTVILVTLLGMVGYFGMGVSLMPKMEFPFVTVMTRYEGATPIDVETLITKPIEDGIAQIPGVRKIESTSLEGLSYVSVEFNSDILLSDAALDVSNKVRTVNLPDDAEDSIVRKFDVNARSFLSIVFTSTLPPQQAYEILEDRVQNRLSQIADVADVSLYGGVEREIHVDLDPLAMASLGVTLPQVSAALKEGNVAEPSGRITLGEKETFFRMTGAPEQSDLLSDIRIPLRNGASARIADVGRVRDSFADVRRLARYNGADSFIVQLTPVPDGNVVRASKEARRILDEILPTLPPGFTAFIPYDDGDYVGQAVDNVIRDMIVGTILTGLVLYLFLRKLSSTILISVAMPVGIVATFIPMYVAGYTMNMMTTLGLAISTGVLVNNSILIIENISRYEDLGHSPAEAARIGTKEIAVAILSSTATNLGVFIPIAFSGGRIGQLFNPFAMTVVFSTLFSLWVALTLTPMMAARMKGSSTPGLAARLLTGWWQWFYEGFEIIHHWLVERAVRHAFLTMLVFAALFAGCFPLFSRIGFQFFPLADEGRLTISIETSSSASLALTDGIVRGIEQYLSKKPNVKGVDAVIGGYGSGTGVNRASVRVYLDDDPGRISTFDLANAIRPAMANLPDTKISYTTSGMRGGIRGKALQLVIRGDDMDDLTRIAGEVVSIWKKIPGVVDVDTDWRTGRPEMSMVPDRVLMARLGVPVDTLSETVKGYLVGMKSGVYRERGKEYDILVRMRPEELDSPRSVPNLPIVASGKTIRLQDLMAFDDSTGPTRILRKDRQRAITVDANTSDITVGVAYQRIDAEMKKIPLPPGFRFTYSGEIEAIQENFGSLNIALILAVLLTFLLIAAIIESFLFALVIMLTVPLSLIGVVPALVITKTPLSIYGLMGVIMLVGLVVNNAIVVIDYAEMVRKEGRSALDSVVEACHVRLRPIFMADATSIIAMLPLAMAMGIGGAYRAPMAIVSIGGLVAGGTLALFVIPPVYVVVWRVIDALKRMFPRSAASV